MYKGTCIKCGMEILSTECHQITEGYICNICGEIHEIKFWFVRAIHLTGAIISKRFHSNLLSNSVRILAKHGWVPIEPISQIKFDKPDHPESMNRVLTC
jgi:hypothetical protein